MRPSRAQLLDEAIFWMIQRVEQGWDRKTSREADSAPQHFQFRPKLKAVFQRMNKKAVQGEISAIVSEVKECVSEAKEHVKEKYASLTLGKADQARVGIKGPLTLKQDVAHAHAVSLLQERATECSHDNTHEWVAAICREWKQPRAAMLAQAWLGGSNFDVESLMDSDNRTLNLIIGVAAAAAILAVVIWVRRGRKIRVRDNGDLEPSADFHALVDVAKKMGGVASKLKDSVNEPWLWTARDGLHGHGLSDDDKRVLLKAFAERGLCNVKRIEPTAGHLFDSRRMKARVSTTQDDVWVVSADVAPEHVGYEIGGDVAIPAQVEVCTADWWVLSRPDCPVGRVIIAHADDLVPGGKAEVAHWRATWGFVHPEDLRKLVATEAELDKWRTRLVRDLNPFYQGRPDRCVVLVGKDNDFFESSVMDAVDGSPVGDALVKEVVACDGVPQRGLACPGGSALLLARVRTKPSGVEA